MKKILILFYMFAAVAMEMAAVSITSPDGNLLLDVADNRKQPAGTESE